MGDDEEAYGGFALVDEADEGQDGDRGGERQDGDWGLLLLKSPLELARTSSISGSELDEVVDGSD